MIYEALRNYNKKDIKERPLPNEMDLAQRIYGAAFRTLASSASQNSSEVGKIYLDKGFPVPLIEYAQGLALAQNQGQWARDLLIESQQAINQIMSIRGHRIPDWADIQTESRPDFRDIPYTPLLTPKEGRREINNLADAVDLALAPGRKVIIVKDKETMTALALATQIKIMINHSKFDDTYNLGIATGSTTEALRKAWGLLADFVKDSPNLNLDTFLQSIGVNKEDLNQAFKKIDCIATLDDYGWTPETLAKAEREIGSQDKIPWTYREEQKKLCVKYLVDDEGQFISPPLGFEYLDGARKEFHAKLEKTLTRSQVFGIGSNGHGGFGEPAYDPLLTDMVVDLTDMTRIQNVGAFLKPDEVRPLGIFLEFAAENQIYDLATIESELRKAIAAQKIPDSLTHRSDQWQLLQNDFEAHWQYLLEKIKRVPKKAITQGVGDIIGRTSFNMVLADRPHKSRAIAKAIEGNIGNGSTLTGLQLAPNTAYIIEEKATRYLKNKHQYFAFELPQELKGPLADKNIDLAYTRRSLTQGKTAWEIAAELNIPLSQAEKYVKELSQDGLS